MLSDRIGPRNLLTGMRAIYTASRPPDDTGLRRHAQPVLGIVPGRHHGSVRPSDLGLRAALIADTMPHDNLTGAMGFNRITSDTARISVRADRRRPRSRSSGMGPAYVVIVSFYAAESILLTSQADSAHSMNAPPSR